MWAWLERILAVGRDEIMSYTVDFDGQGTSDDVEVFPLPRVEVCWRLFTGTSELQETRVVRVDGDMEVNIAAFWRGVFGNDESTFKS